MKLAIISAIWQRKQLTEVFLKSVQRYWKDYAIHTMIAGSEGTLSREMCLDAGAGYIETPNEPLSGKFNKAILNAHIAYQPNGFIVLGSDDFMNDIVIEKYLSLLELGCDFAGFKDCYYYDAKAKQGYFWAGWTVKHRVGESIGMGRLLSQKAFQSLNGRPWSNGNRGLDWIMTQRLKKKKLNRQILTMRDNNYVMVDVKGFGSISSLGSYDLEPVDSWCFRSIPEFSEIEKL